MFWKGYPVTPGLDSVNESDDSSAGTGRGESVVHPLDAFSSGRCDNHARCLYILEKSHTLLRGLTRRNRETKQLS